MSAIIIEDEKPAARRLNKLVSQLDIKVLKTLHSVSEAINWFANNKQPELLFLDIQLSDGLSFEIYDHIKLKSAIIFTTAYDEYALKAFKLNSVDYLLKPIDQSELETAVQKFKTQAKPHTYDVEMIKNLFLNNMNQQDYKE
ncbi:MAG: LytR/AlgR family response regulator transcription factor, partial [Psychroflexus salarius]